MTNQITITLTLHEMSMLNELSRVDMSSDSEVIGKLITEAHKKLMAKKQEHKGHDWHAGPVKGTRTCQENSR